eukprot:g287.t1
MEGRQKVVAQLRQLHNDLQDGLRLEHLTEVLVGLGLRPKAAQKVVDLFREATSSTEPSELREMDLRDLPVRFMDWLCGTASGHAVGAEMAAVAMNEPTKVEDVEVTSDELLQMQAMNGRQTSTMSQERRTWSEVKQGNPKLYTRRPSMMTQPKPLINKRLSVEISEALLQSLDEDTSTWTGKEAAERASSSSTVIVFDWDDTLLPTTAVVDGELDSKKSILEAHAEHVRETLQLAASLGRVAIVTLAARPWLQVSAKRYMPSVDWEHLFHELNIPIVYSREVLDKRHMMAASQERGDQSEREDDGILQT